MPNCVKDGWGGVCPGCDGVSCVVPTATVPRAAGFVQVVAKTDPIRRAVDDYLLMERKAKAWGALRRDLLRQPGVALRGVPIEDFLDALLSAS